MFAIVAMGKTACRCGLCVFPKLFSPGWSRNDTWEMLSESCSVIAKVTWRDSANTVPAERKDETLTYRLAPTLSKINGMDRSIIQLVGELIT